MKFSVSSSCSGRRDFSRDAFTLPEILIALAIFMLVLGGIVTGNLFGLRMFQVNQDKLNATEWSRRTFGKITDEVRSCSSVTVGNMTTNEVFTGLLPGEMLEGNAIEIQPGTNATSLIFYFVDSIDQTFRRKEQLPGGTNTFILADSATNTMVFSAQNFSGNVMTNTSSGSELQNNQIIHLTLEFYQPERFLVGPDSYRLETSVTRRAVQ